LFGESEFNSRLRSAVIKPQKGGKRINPGKSRPTEATCFLEFSSYGGRI
jgi:hypothetical protein